MIPSANSKLTLAITFVTFAAFISCNSYADPPGMIVIRPKGNSTANDYAPDKPGYIVIRPSRMTSLLQGNQVPSPDTKTIPKDSTAILPTPIVQTPAPFRPEQELKKEEGKVVLETWDAAFIKGQQIGYFHIVVREYERDGKKYLYATKTQKIAFKKLGQIGELSCEDSTMETPEGEILVTRMRQEAGKDQKLSLTGQVANKKLSVKIEGAMNESKTIDWPDNVVGIAKEATLLRDKKPKPGESFDYLYYVSHVTRVAKFTVAAKAFEELALYEGEKPRKLLKVEMSMEPIGEFKLPTSTMYCDAQTYEPLRMEADMPSLGGRMVLVRTTKEAAMRPPGNIPDLFDIQSIRLDREVPNIHSRTAVTYRVTLTGDLSPEKAFAQDDRQTVKNIDGKTFDLEIKLGTSTLKAGEKPGAEPGKEFLTESYFIDWDNDLVKKAARRAVDGLPQGATTIQKAKAIEKWVNENMKPTAFSSALVTSTNIAKTLSGDCKQYAMLATGMCRAEGIPSRTAMGLVYAPSRDGKPFLAYHMWFEVWNEGKWVGLDATLGNGGVGPGHVKITDASWDKERSFAPLLPVLSVLSSTPKFEVLKVVDKP